MRDIESEHIQSEKGSESKFDIPLSAPLIQGNEWRYVKECLDSGWVSSAGAYVTRFEQSIADYVGADAATATASGTAALHLSLLVVGVEPDDEVLIPTMTFVATANAVRYAGAWPVFMDVDPVYWQMDVEKTLAFLRKDCKWKNGALYNKATGRRVKAILPVHLLGHPADMDPLLEAAHEYGLAVIEDAAESLGAKYLRNRHLGRGEWVPVGALGDIACFSFNGNKVITTGGGGMIVTSNKTWAQKARYLSTQAKEDGDELVHGEVGYNYRLSNIAAAVGLAQVELLDRHIAAKHRIAKAYEEGLAEQPGIMLPAQADWAKSIFWLYTILVDVNLFGVDSRTLFRKLRMAGIESRPFWRPLHMLEPFKNCFAYRIETAASIYRDGLSLPSSVGMEASAQAKVIRTVVGSAVPG